jgi:hypothetical protein
MLPSLWRTAVESSRDSTWRGEFGQAADSGYNLESEGPGKVKGKERRINGEMDKGKNSEEEKKKRDETAKGRKGKRKRGLFTHFSISPFPPFPFVYIGFTPARKSITALLKISF